MVQLSSVKVPTHTHTHTHTHTGTPTHRKDYIQKKMFWFLKEALQKSDGSDMVLSIFVNADRATVVHRNDGVIHTYPEIFIPKEFKSTVYFLLDGRVVGETLNSMSPGDMEKVLNLIAAEKNVGGDFPFWWISGIFEIMNFIEEEENTVTTA